MRRLFHDDYDDDFELEFNDDQRVSRVLRRQLHEEACLAGRRSRGPKRKRQRDHDDDDSEYEEAENLDEFEDDEDFGDYDYDEYDDYDDNDDEVYSYSDNGRFH